MNNYEKKEMIPLSLTKSKKYIICVQKDLVLTMIKRYHKVRDHSLYTGKYRGATHSICNLRYKTAKVIPVLFHNGSTYDLSPHNQSASKRI